MKKNQKLKKIGIGLAIFVAVLFTFYFLWAAWENHSGARKWKATREKLVEANVELDFKKLIPEMPKPEDNFARTPLIAAVTDFKQKDGPDSKIIYENPELRNRFLAVKLPDMKEVDLFPSWQAGKEVDLDAVQKALTTEVGSDISVVDWLKQFDAEFAEIDAAGTRPEAQLAVNIGETFIDHVNTIMPYLTEFRDYQRVQSIRASAALARGDTEQARMALQTSFQLYHTSASHPTLIGYLVGQVSLEYGLSIIWQGMKTKAWAVDDLVWIQDQLDPIEVLDELEQALVFEMVTFQIGAGNFLKDVSQKDSRELVNLVGGIESYDSTGVGLLAPTIPSGIWDHNMSYGCEAMFECLILPIRERRLPDADAIISQMEERSLRNFLASLTLPAISTLAEKGFNVSVGVDLARVACAVELFALRSGDYPDSLDQLTPEFIEKIPADLMAEGKTLRYEKGAEGDRYRIYSVGKNMTDEGGQVEFKSNGSRRDLDKGDWAWGYDFKSVKP